MATSAQLSAAKMRIRGLVSSIFETIRDENDQQRNQGGYGAQPLEARAPIAFGGCPAIGAASCVLPPYTDV
jgi:hypothetical protein